MTAMERLSAAIELVQRIAVADIKSDAIKQIEFAKEICGLGVRERAPKEAKPVRRKKDAEREPVGVN